VPALKNSRGLEGAGGSPEAAFVVPLVEPDACHDKMVSRMAIHCAACLRTLIAFDAFIISFVQHYDITGNG
jgi:hypothetical protein